MTTFSTVAEVHGLSEWRQTVNSLLLPLVIESVDADHFSARIETCRVGGIRLFNVWASPHTLERTSRLAEAGADPVYSISLQLTGRSTVTQNGNHGVLEPGDFAVYDSTLPYRREFPVDSRTLVVIFPQQMIALPPRALAGIGGVRIAGSEGLGRIVSPFLVGIAENLAVLGGRTGLSVTQSVVEMVSAAFVETIGVVAATAGAGGSAAVTPCARLEQTMRIREHIMARLGDADLTPAVIAAHHFISTRHLHHLFREQGTSVATWIRERRLEMSRRDLSDPMREGETIREVASRWGFVDATHFSTLFRRTYGASPREYRRSALGE
ncbi:helix-turn-helix domain-containing protein [Klugiella xanthotipulae]|uniref:AraC-like DNA-binding protein n=1 Tax=Klugiella xanthotipulae TaxID=244735 RepID=A0A543HYS8_9MICO|nr:helix-turn-helix domain-containing protein [Klugiella xanthotipulae]TQM63513.1 AraC-like DNA-binding protein [Klugiella xanthotipulae]